MKLEGFLGRARIGCVALHPKRKFEVGGSHVFRQSLLLNGQLIVEHLFEQQFSYLAIDAPHARIERRHCALVFVEDFIGNLAKLAPQLSAVKFGEPLAAMPLEEATQRFVKKTSRVKRGQVERRFTARLQL